MTIAAKYVTRSHFLKSITGLVFENTQEDDESCRGEEVMNHKGWRCCNAAD